MLKLTKQLGILTLLIGLSSCAGGSFLSMKSDKSTYEADLIVYGGTSAAITSAVQAARMGKSVLVVSPDTHLGGLSSGGLGFTDTGNKQVIGGLAREFYHRIYLHYQKEESWQWQKKQEYGNKGQGTPA
uniref:FAD-dependent oxidoreductase n=1 Tax=Daejeonella sp. TaxID=2805397 RepID=UPI0039832F0E